MAIREHAQRGRPAQPGGEPVTIAGACESEAAGAAYGAMTFSVGPHGATEMHQHASAELWLVRSGVGRAVLGSQDVGMIAGSRISVAANLPHRIVNESGEPLVVLGFWWRAV